MIRGEILLDRSLISIAGEGVEEFLQGLITNDIKNLIREKIIYSLMLTPQGKFLYDFFIFKKSGIVFIDCFAADREEIISKFNLYKLGKAILLNKEDAYKILFVSSVIPEMADPRFLGGASRLYVSDNDLDNIIAKYNIELSKDEHMSFLCSNTYPDASYDMIKNRSFPLEYGIDNYNAISFTKGCYVGQELVARTKYRGTIRKKIFRIESDTDLVIEKGSDVMVGDKVIGIFCSSYKKLGKVLLRDDVLTEISSGASKLEATISDLKVMVII
jgi:folate-binding protein YgfZ